MSTPVKSPKKLIEVALPLDAINVASAKEKSIRHGHPSTLHLWWARRPLAAARAVIFAQMVNDPGGERGYFAGMTKAQAAAKREELFKIIEDMVLWENTNDVEVLKRAQEAIWDSWRETCRLNKGHPQASELFNPEKLPAFHDPFAGGGAIPLEAQRLGLESFASDLNPVAVAINKAMIEVPPRFVGKAPVGPTQASNKQQKLHEDWSGTKGLVEDIRRYATWLRTAALKRVGDLYPLVEITDATSEGRPDLKVFVGEKLTPIAYLWARTVKSPNPAFGHAEVPLASSFVLYAKEGRETYVHPIIDGDRYRFTIRLGKPDEAAENGTKAKGRGANFFCLLSGTPIGGDYIKSEGQAGRLGVRLMAVVADGKKGRVYLSPTPEQEFAAAHAKPEWRPTGEVPSRLTGGTCVPYGLSKWGDLFTARQLVALTTFADLVPEAIARAHHDALGAGWLDDDRGLSVGGTGATAYAQAIGLYLALAASKSTMFINSLSRWRSGEGKTAPSFGRQALAMVWDYAEVNPFAGAGGDFYGVVDGGAKALESFSALVGGLAVQWDAQTQKISTNKVVSTDPPYYDNIAYADLSDFFYGWLRRSLRPIYPELFATLAVPKAEELVAAAYRHGSHDEAEAFFLNGMTSAIRSLAEQAHPAFPVTIYYAFKQSETSGEVGTHSTGWETFLAAVVRAGFAITGTWPMRTESATRMIGSGTNALASSIVLVCRKRAHDAPQVSRREFLRELNAALPDALLDMTRGGVNSPVAPVDLSQAIIGPGMAIFSQYSSVLEADGSAMGVKAALRLINKFLSEDDFDADSQFCLHWFETMGWATGKYGEADVLARAKGTSVGGLIGAGVVESSGGQARLYKWTEYATEWVPENESHLAVWEMLHHLVRLLNLQGEGAAGALLAQMPEKAESVRALAYRLYTLCERKGWSEDARAYNELITSWAGIEIVANEIGPRGAQTKLDI